MSCPGRLECYDIFNQSIKPIHVMGLRFLHEDMVLAAGSTAVAVSPKSYWWPALTARDVAVSDSNGALVPTRLLDRINDRYPRLANLSAAGAPLPLNSSIPDERGNLRARLQEESKAVQWGQLLNSLIFFVKMPHRS